MERTMQGNTRQKIDSFKSYSRIRALLLNHHDQSFYSLIRGPIEMTSALKIDLTQNHAMRFSTHYFVFTLIALTNSCEQMSHARCRGFS
jgi:hypothetical protein